MPSAPTIVRSRISFSSLYEQMSTSIEGGCSSDESHPAFASASGDRSRVRVRKKSESAAVAIPISSATRKTSASAYSKLNAGAGSVCVIRHHTYWLIMAKLPATMKARPVATGLGQIAAQTKNSPSVTRAGWAAARTISSTNGDTVQLSEIEPLRCGPVSSPAALAVSAWPSPKVTVPVRPIEHPASPMSSMAIVT